MRGGKAAKRRREHGLYRAKRTGSHRNLGKGYSTIPIASREAEYRADANPSSVQRPPALAPDCDRDHPMHLEDGRARTFFWVCSICEQAIAYKPLRTGLKHA